jgi:hypothetical protein
VPYLESVAVQQRRRRLHSAVNLDRDESPTSRASGGFAGLRVLEHLVPKTRTSGREHSRASAVGAAQRRGSAV